MWVLVGAVVLLGGYSIYKNKAKDMPENPELAPTFNTETGKKIPFSEFVKQGGSYKCEVHQALSDFENTGTVYLSGGMMRGEFTTIAEGRNMDTTFVYKDGFMHTWSNLMPGMGFKMKADPTLANNDAAASGTYSWNATEIGDYDCVVWTADASKFEIPTNITVKEPGK